MLYKVCHISTVHSLGDVRIFEKECTTLAEEGYDVYFIVTSDKKFIKNNVKIIPLSKNTNRSYRILIKIWEAFFKALKVNASIYHFHDPELIIVGVLLKLMGKKVIYDVHEDVSSQILNKYWIKFKFLRVIISKMFYFYEKFAAKIFDGVISVTPDIVDKFKVKRKILLRNYPVLSKIQKIKPVYKKEDRKVIIYVGALTEIRGIKEVLDAIGKFKGEVEFWILGEWDNENYKIQCKNSIGWKYTKYIGSKPLNEVYKYMKAADIGVCILYPVENYLQSLPIKVFEYMACGLPVIMSSFDYWIEKFKDVAEFVDPKNPDRIYEKIRFMLDNEELEKARGKKGNKIVEEICNWEKERKKLIDLYECIIDYSKSVEE